MKKLIILASLALLPLVSSSQNTNIRQFIGFSADNLILRGSYDGVSYFNTDNEIILVPKIEPGFGGGVTYGFSFGKAAFDFSYHLTVVKYSSLEEGFSGSANINTIRYLGAKVYLGQTEDKKLRPYLDIDLSVSFTKFKNIAYPIGSLSTIKSANYGGIIMGMGAGLEYFVAESVSFNLNVLPEFYIGTDIKMKGSDRYEVKKFSNFMLMNSFGLRFYLKGRQK